MTQTGAKNVIWIYFTLFSNTNKSDASTDPLCLSAGMKTRMNKIKPKNLLWQAFLICCRMFAAPRSLPEAGLFICSPAVSCSCHWLLNAHNPYVVVGNLRAETSMRRIHKGLAEDTFISRASYINRAEEWWTQRQVRGAGGCTHIFTYDYVFCVNVLNFGNATCNFASLLSCRCTSRPQPWPSLWALVRLSPWECSTCPRSTWCFSIQSRMCPSANGAWRLWSLQPPCPTSLTPKAPWGPTGRPSQNSAKVWKRKVGITSEGPEAGIDVYSQVYSVDVLNFKYFFLTQKPSSYFSATKSSKMWEILFL